MLKALTVRNFALVDQLEIQLGRGLTVITGESGAGKSILLGALGLVLGDRATLATIRPGTERADVSAEFDTSELPAVADQVAEQALDDPDQPGRLLVRRVLSRDGRSRAFVNGTPVTLSALRSITEGIIDIHGQDDHQRLVDPENQLALLDAYGVNGADLTACRQAFRSWKAATTERARRETQLAGQEDRAALLTYQLEELHAAAPGAGEFEEAASSHRRLSRAHEIREVINRSRETLEATESLDRLATDLARLDDDHPQLAAARETLTTLVDLRTDALRDLRAYESSLEVDSAALAELEERLELLHELARKHRVTPESLPELIVDLATELDAITTDRTTLDGLTAEAERQEQLYRERAAAVSQQRRAAAESFCGAVSAHMNALGIRGGALALEFRPRESERGSETVEYLCVTNPKYPAAPLAKIASGGERTRISLAIQIVAAQRMRLPSLVLDEADVGVGGTTADVVGRLLRGLAQHTQVLCITHAPQIAALGDRHLKVHKDGEQDTRITALGADARIDELARMLAGAAVTEESRDYARTLLAQAGAG